eukprot:9352912-Pyramimonas_sp.AAC.1
MDVQEADPFADIDDCGLGPDTQRDAGRNSHIQGGAAPCDDYDDPYMTNRAQQSPDLLRHASVGAGPDVQRATADRSVGAPQNSAQDDQTDWSYAQRVEQQQ